MPAINDIARIIQTALVEDRVYHDITTKTLIRKKQISSAYIITRQDGVLCGTKIVREIFKKFNPAVKVFAYHSDGEKIIKNAPVVFLKGPTRSLLSCERVALNFLGHLSGVATVTNQFVEAVKPYKVKILDTRKTTPGLRDLEKYAVTCGGGKNHRRDLSTMVLIKDNHIAALQGLSLAQAVTKAHTATRKTIEIEVESIAQFKDALAANPDIVLLDNMSLGQLRAAVQIKRRLRASALLEASGGVSLKTVNAIAATGIDRISIGELTHSARAVDFSMEFVT